eukprot:166146-Rhodomonas_salina.1
MYGEKGRETIQLDFRGDGPLTQVLPVLPVLPVANSHSKVARVDLAEFLCGGDGEEEGGRV